MKSLSHYTHEAAPGEFIEAEGIRYAYRRFGKEGQVPILFLSYLSSNMDGWDPIVANGLAEGQGDHLIRQRGSWSLRGNVSLNRRRDGQ